MLSDSCVCRGGRVGCERWLKPTYRGADASPGALRSSSPHGPRSGETELPPMCELEFVSLESEAWKNAPAFCVATVTLTHKTHNPPPPIVAKCADCVIFIHPHTAENNHI